MKTITLEIPDDAAIPGWCSEDEFPAQLRLAAATHWYERGLISQGKGAAIAGLTRAGFIRAFSDAKVSPLQVTAEELKAELAKNAVAPIDDPGPDDFDPRESYPNVDRVMVNDDADDPHLHLYQDQSL